MNIVTQSWSPSQWFSIFVNLVFLGGRGGAVLHVMRSTAQMIDLKNRQTSAIEMYEY